MLKQNDKNKKIIRVKFLELLTLVFIGLKLTDNIDWSWVWVLSPFWGLYAFIASFLALTVLFASICWLFIKANSIIKKR